MLKSGSINRNHVIRGDIFQFIAQWGGYEK